MKLLTHEKPAEPMSADLYKALGASRHDDLATIALKYKRLCRLYHPDTSFQPDAASKFKAITAAFAVLSDADRRALYDEFGKVPQSDLEITKEAEGLVLQLLDGLFNQVKGCDESQFDFSDPLQGLRNVVDEQIADGAKKIKIERSFTRKMHKLVERTSRKSGDNMIAVVAQHRLEQQKADLFKLLSVQLVFKRVRAVLESYEYEKPQAPVEFGDTNNILLDIVGNLWAPYATPRR